MMWTSPLRRCRRAREALADLLAQAARREQRRLGAEVDARDRDVGAGEPPADQVGAGGLPRAVGADEDDQVSGRAEPAAHAVGSRAGAGAEPAHERPGAAPHAGADEPAPQPERALGLAGLE